MKTTTFTFEPNTYVVLRSEKSAADTGKLDRNQLQIYRVHGTSKNKVLVYDDDNPFCAISFELTSSHRQAEGFPLPSTVGQQT